MFWWSLFPISCKKKETKIKSFEKREICRRLCAMLPNENNGFVLYRIFPFLPLFLYSATSAVLSKQLCVRTQHSVCEFMRLCEHWSVLKGVWESVLTDVPGQGRLVQSGVFWKLRETLVQTPDAVQAHGQALLNDLHAVHQGCCGFSHMCTFSTSKATIWALQKPAGYNDIRIITQTGQGRITCCFGNIICRGSFCPYVNVKSTRIVCWGERNPFLIATNINLSLPLAGFSQKSMFS